MRSKKVSGFEEYIVYEDGRIFSIKQGDFLKPYKLKSDTKVTYPTVSLCNKGKIVTKRVHAIVCEAFHGPKPKWMVCRHLDGDPENSHAHNLKWGTHKENIADKKTHGNALLGENHQNAQITTEQVHELFRFLLMRKKHSWISKKTGIGLSNVSMIATGKAWSHIHIKYKSQLQSLREGREA